MHRFANLPKKALETMFHRFDQMVICVGFCIESKDEHEMPETLFGCATLNRPSHQHAIKVLEDDGIVVACRSGVTSNSDSCCKEIQAAKENHRT